MMDTLTSSFRQQTTPSLMMGAVLIAFVYAINSWFVIAAADVSGGMAAIWSANAILLFAVLGKARKRAAAYYLGGFLASVAANMLTKSDLGLSLCYSVANITEVWLTAELFQRWKGQNDENFSPSNLTLFAVIALFVPAVSATIAMSMQGNIGGPGWLSWYSSDVLGLLLVVPALDVCHNHFRMRGIASRRSQETAKRLGAYGLVFLASLVTFLQQQIPTLFIIAVPALIAVFSAGRIGAVVSTSIVAIVSITATLFDMGPVATWGASETAQIYLLQCFLACQLLISLPVASVLEERDRNAERTLHSERQLRQLAESARREAEKARRALTVLSATDELTGMFTRARIIQKLQFHFDRCQKSEQPFSIAIFDIDHFKQVNDRYGHLVGDDVLRELGAIARTVVQRRFALGRLGGEEFILLLPGVDMKMARSYSELLRLAIMQKSGQNTECKITISLGVAQARKGDDIKELMRSADHALYDAKAKGRNRLRTAA
jgi:diguanylate cyclase